MRKRPQVRRPQTVLKRLCSVREECEADLQFPPPKVKMKKRKKKKKFGIQQQNIYLNHYANLSDPSLPLFPPHTFSVPINHVSLYFHVVCSFAVFKFCKAPFIVLLLFTRSTTSESLGSAHCKLMGTWKPHACLHGVSEAPFSEELFPLCRPWVVLWQSVNTACVKQHSLTHQQGLNWNPSPSVLFPSSFSSCGLQPLGSKPADLRSLLPSHPL